MPDLSKPIDEWLPTTIYVGFRPEMPDIIMGKWPAAFGRHGEDQYKTWICETNAELKSVRAALARPAPLRGGAIDFLRGPDAPVRGRGRGIGGKGSIYCCLYSSPGDGWPWLVLVALPFEAPGNERGIYSWDAFDTEDAAINHLARLQMMIKDMPVEFLSPVAPN